MRYQALAVVALMAVASAAPAQTRFEPRTGPELRPLIGAYVPTGNQADNFKSAAMVGGQIALEMSDYFHIVGEFSWVPNKVKFTGLSSTGMDMYQYDAGVEFNLLRHINDAWLFRPFIGMGGGGRTYSYVAANVSRNTQALGYGTLGVEFERSLYSIRIEARDNMSRFEMPATSANPGDKFNVNDLHFSIGLAYHMPWR